MYTFFFLPRHVACGILVPQPAIQPMLPALEAQTLSHWTAREVPIYTVVLEWASCGFIHILQMPVSGKMAHWAPEKELSGVSRARSWKLDR